MKVKPDIRRGAAAWLLTGLALSFAGAGHAQERPATRLDDTFTLSGFGTIGFARSDRDSAEYVRDLSQPAGVKRQWTAKVDSLFGVQATLKASERTAALIQVVSRYHNDSSHRPEIAWAFLRHEPTPGVVARLGRLGTEFYMLADSRLVGYANVTVRPPPDFYGPLIFSYFDGVDIGATRPLGNGLLRGKVFAGRAAEISPMTDTITWNLKGSPIAGAHVDYLIGSWQWRLGHARIRYAREAPLDDIAGFPIRAMAPELRTKDQWASFDSLGAVYDDGPLQVQAMVSRIDYGTAAYVNSRAGYVVASWRLNRLTPYVGYSRVLALPPRFLSSLPPPLDALMTDFVARTTGADQHTTTLGLRWDVARNVAVKAQFDAVRGSPDASYHFRHVKPGWDGRVNVVSLALDFIF